MKDMAMNWFDVSDGVTRRVLARCGVVHPHADLDPKRTALIVVDLQNAFMDDEVGHAVCPMAREIVPDVNRLACCARGGWRRVLDQEHVRRTQRDRMEQRARHADAGKPRAPDRGDERG
jgi:nicotinamidase-related amidase